MAITRTALGTGAVKSTSVDVTIGNVVAAGDQLFVIVAQDPGANPIRYQPQSGAASEFFTEDVAASHADVVARVMRLSNPTPSIDSTAVVGSNNNVTIAIAIIKVSGLDTSPFDKSSAGTGSSLEATSGATGTTAQANEILIGAIGWEGPDGDDAGTWQNSFSTGQRIGTTGGGAASNVTIQEGYLIVSATGAYTAAVTRTANSRDWAAAIATYKGFRHLAPVINQPFAAIPQIIQV
jgi:hypothetical protein